MTDGSNTKRLEWVDAAKGLAILLVLIVHSKYRTYTVGHPDDSISSGVWSFVSFVMPAYMPLFFFLSGFVFREKTDLIASRAKTILKPYFVWGGIYCLYQLINSLLINIPNSKSILVMVSNMVTGILYSRHSLYPSGTPNNIFFFPSGAAPLWFLTCIFVSYVLFDILYRSRKKALVIILLLAAGYCLSFSRILYPWSIDTATWGALFIYAGYICRKYDFFNYKYIELLLICAIIYIFYKDLTSANGYINMSNRTLGRSADSSPLLFLLIGVTGSILLSFMVISLSKLRLTRALAYLGKMSLLLLCSHCLIFKLLEQMFAKDSIFYVPVLDENNYLFALQFTFAITFCVIVHEAKTRNLVPFIGLKISNIFKKTKASE